MWTVAEAVDVQPVAAQAPTPVETAAIEAVTPEISSPADITDPAQKPGFFSRMPQRAGFFGRMFGGGRGDTPAATPKAEPAAAQAPAPRRGWFQPAPRTGPDAQLVSERPLRAPVFGRNCAFGRCWLP